MKELETILAKLDKLTYIKADRDSLETKEGFKVSLFTKFHSSKNGGLKLPSVQVKLDVRYKGRQIKGWGCYEIEDTKLVVDFFLDKKLEIESLEYKEDSHNELVGETIYNNL